ncbi:uncharacterized protein LOC121387646 [Gigantopelta aegis]|uniref:uncharacterized protein LOC121387646 n=1 Tax=Gigantopelta aegis TaxID=1735272 RepID=UPI001B88D8C9|nr:uncharacterized protein LOC121387646 [Gigantopelta aegis]
MHSKEHTQPGYKLMFTHVWCLHPRRSTMHLRWIFSSLLVFSVLMSSGVVYYRHINYTWESGLSPDLFGVGVCGEDFMNCTATTETYRTNEHDLLLEYTRRQKNLQDICLTHPAGKLRRIISHDRYKLACCVVPKAGCTFWINVFRFLYNETGEVNVNSPNDIPRLVTHRGPRRKMKFYNMTTAGNFLPYTFRFLFTREPYSRLWSAYVDKFLLPDFWCLEAKRIGDQRWNRRRNRPSGFCKRFCVSDVSFVELLNHIVLSDIDELNEHLSPVSHMCDPCTFRPDVIGTMETFAKDSYYILSQVNLGHLIGDHNTKTYVEHELAMLTEYNFGLFQFPYCGRCMNRADVAKRLWKAFQINGYLPNDAKLPLEHLKNITTDRFLDIAMKTYRERPSSPAQMKRQKKKALIDAYRSVPQNIMDKLKSIYATDFLMFDYDPDPSWLKFKKSKLRT